jgi:hypothetical protein
MGIGTGKAAEGRAFASASGEAWTQPGGVLFGGLRCACRGRWCGFGRAVAPLVTRMGGRARTAGRILKSAPAVPQRADACGCSLCRSRLDMRPKKIFSSRLARDV